MAIIVRHTINLKPPFKSDIATPVVKLYKKFLVPNYYDRTPITIRKSLLEPGTYIAEPGSFCLRPVEELIEQDRRRKNSLDRQVLIARLKNGS